MGLRGSGRLVGVFLKFFKITKKNIEEKNLKKFGRLSFFGEASGYGRLVGTGGLWVREASGCRRLVGVGG